MRIGLIFMLALLAAAGPRADSLRVAVAANFKPTLEAINEQFTAASGVRVTLSSASTGVLASQVLHGAPFDLFFAADVQSPARLAAQANATPFCYARGRLVLAGGTLADLRRPQLTLAIANPATAPYGRAAAQVLARADVAASGFDSGERAPVRGASVAQAYQFWHSGAVDLALLPLSMAPDGAIVIPAHWHAPIEQHAIVLRPSAQVRRYLNWIRSDTVRSLIREAGYEPCP